MIAIALLAYTTMERLAELPLARANTRRLRAAGAHEVAPGHYPAIVTLHVAWLAGLWWLAPGRETVWPWVWVYLALQLLRIWTLASLGRRWTTRIIVVPGETLVRRGPYRFLSHPNYVVVVGEIAALPLAFGLTGFALVFTLANAALLTIRIRAEDRALGR